MSEYPKAYAVWHPNDEIRLKSSSGGAFTLFAEKVIDEGGVVFGAAWDEYLNVSIVPAETREDLAKFRGSKYVFSDASKSYAKVIEFLEAGRKVMYSGSPCQIAALKMMLKGREFNNLITVDFICHGMPEKKVFQKYIKYLEAEFDDRISSVDFRDKRFGVECNLLLKVALQRRGVQKIILGKENTYYYGFIHNIFLRKCCSVCKFNKLPRQADVSLCDYRGLGEHVLFPWEADKTKGFTGVLANSDNGLAFIKSIPQDTIKERPIDELTGSQACLNSPSTPSSAYAGFMDDLESMPWKELSAKYLRPSLRYQLYILLRRLLGAALFLRLGIIYKRWKGIRTTSWFLPRKGEVE